MWMAWHRVQVVFCPCLPHARGTASPLWLANRCDSSVLVREAPQDELRIEMMELRNGHSAKPSTGFGLERHCLGSYA